MTGWIETKDLAIKCVREPCQRMPISCMKSSEGPPCGVPRQPLLDMGIPGDINAVVEFDEPVMGDGIVKRQSGGDQCEAENAHIATRKGILPL